MSYYDPNFYNDDALNEEERKLIKIYDMAIENASNKDFIIDDLMALGSDEGEYSTLDKIKREIAGEAIDCVIEYMNLQRMELLVSMLDNRPEEVEQTEV